MPSDPTIESLVDLRGRRALVTGGGKGIGLAIATRLVEAGATVTKLPASEVKAWAAGLPNLAGEWVEANADRGAKEVLDAYMAKIRAAGLTMGIDWSKR